MKPIDLQFVNTHQPFGKIKWILLGTIMLFSYLTYAQVSINTDGSPPDPSAMLEVKSVNKGLLFPRLFQANRPGLPPAGLMIYQIDNGPGIYYYDGAAWQKMSMSSYDFWNPNGSDIYFSAGRVGIGLDNPDFNGLNVSNYTAGRGAVRGGDQNGELAYAEGYLGVLAPEYLGVPTGTYPYNVGVLGIKLNNGANGAAVYGWNNDENSLNYAGLFYADGAFNQATNYGIYSIAEKANQNFAGYFRGRVSVEGNSGSDQGNDTTSTLLKSLVKHVQYVDTKAIEGVSVPQPGYGYGVYGEGGWRGVYGHGNGLDYPGTTIGVLGYATGTEGERIGVYGYATGGALNWGSYFIGSNYMSDDLRIGTTSAATGFRLSVNGKIACTEVLVNAMASWPDYVFKPDYKLMSLENLEQSIRDNGHLPGFPSAEEVETNGLHLGNIQKQIVEKVEELTLYTIEQAKLLKEQGNMLQEFKKEMEVLKAENQSLRRMIKSK